MNAAKEKKTFWGHIKSWFATTWIWNTIKNLFSSNDASKVNTTKQKAETTSQPKDKGVKVGQEHKVTNTPPLKPKNQEAAPQPEKAKKGKPDVDSGANDDTKPKTVAKPEKKIEGVITIHDGNLVLKALPFWSADIEVWKNPADDKEYLLYVQCGDNVYRITGINQYSPIGGYETERYIYNINSVLKQGDDGKFDETKVVSPDNNMPGITTLLGFNETTKVVEITHISNKPFPKVEIPAPTATDGEPNPLVTSPKPVAADKSKSK